MNHKKKQKQEESQGVMAGIKRIWVACKANPLGALVIALGSVLFVGVINSFCENFYDSCSKAMGNASVGFWHKFVDLYYINAAKAELTDVAETIYLTLYCVIVVALWAVVSFLKSDIERMKGNLRELDDIEDEMAEEGKVSTTNAADTLCSLDKLRRRKARELRRRVRCLRDEIAKDLRQSNKECFKRNISCLIWTFVIILQVSIDLMAYNTLKKYRHRVSAVRPFITTIEHQTLDRQWILMRTKLDHQKIMETIETYEKRAETQTKKNIVP